MNFQDRLKARVFHRNQLCEVHLEECNSFPVAELTSVQGDSKKKICIECISSLMNQQEPIFESEVINL
ncbi:hypothetical protein [uncultured Brevibacillus sp.]|uniref:hypothetical protein n=1 Tax=uncultured Brevibacillus sp. TaxID=169970 RepID=UPI0025973297|nr:hypothetical protein [uncultured Brevibacillus sp.]